MADPVKFTIDGREIQAAPGTLVINAAKQAGIEIPAFCYYDGYSLTAACRMCLVEVEKMPKMQTACTLPVAAGKREIGESLAQRGVRVTAHEHRAFGAAGGAAQDQSEVGLGLSHDTRVRHVLCPQVQHAAAALADRGPADS